MYKILTYAKSTDNNRYYIKVLDLDNNNEIIVRAYTRMALTIHKAFKPKKELSIEGECSNKCELFRFIVKEYPLFIFYTPEEYVDESLLVDLICKNPNVLGYIDKSKRTPDLCMIAVNLNGLCYRFVPDEVKELLGEDLKLKAIMQNVDSFKHIKDKSFHVCEVAVLQKPSLLRDVPELYIVPLYRELKEMDYDLSKHLTELEIMRYDSLLKNNVLDIEHLLKLSLVN